MESNTNLNGKQAVFVLSNGCHESFMDAAMLESYIDGQDKYSLTRDMSEADIILLLGCSVMQRKEEQTRELIKTLEQRKKPGAKLAIAGCISKVIPELARSPEESASLTQEIDTLLGMKEPEDQAIPHAPYRPYRGEQQQVLKEVRSRLRQKQLVESVPSAQPMSGKLVARLGGVATKVISKYDDFVQKKIDVWTDQTYTIKISTGCRGSCSYCSIKQARGQVRSRPIEKIAADFQKGLEQGYADFALIGTDIGDYGKDRDQDLLDLLRSLTSLSGSFRMRLRNVNPRWLIPSASKLCEILQTNKISYIQSPIQSASNNVLKLMNRGYNAEEMLEAVGKIRKAYPKIFIKTQIIVGFPGEDEEDFHRNEELYKSRLFNYIDVFRYSDRPNTLAKGLPNRVPAGVAYARERRLMVKSLFLLAPKQLVRNWLPSRT